MFMVYFIVVFITKNIYSSVVVFLIHLFLLSLRGVHYFRGFLLLLLRLIGRRANSDVLILFP